MQNNNNNNNVRKTIPEPLMFIHTVSTPIMTNGSRKYYDSREGSSQKVIHSVKPTNNLVVNTNNIDSLLYKKIQNVVQMYEKSHKIPCLIETKNNESIEGVPYKIEDNTLLIKKDDETINVLLNDIKDVVILKI